MFAPKSFEKLPSTAREVYRNKLRLEELSVFEPFATTNLNGLAVLQYPDFEDFLKVINSIRVMDNNGHYLPK